MARRLLPAALVFVLLPPALGCASSEARPVFHVHTAEEFVQAIGPKREVILDPCTYVISGLPRSRHLHVRWEDVHDGDQIIVYMADGLSLRTEGDEPAEVLVSPRYANVMTFKDCKSISIGNIVFGHTKGDGTCGGGVLSFTRCEDVSIRNVVLHGSGYEGLTVRDSTSVTFANSIIRDCTYRLLDLSDSSGIRFLKARLLNSRQYELVSIRRCDGVVFQACEIRGNRAGCEGENTDYPLFSIHGSSDIALFDSSICGNEADYLLSREGACTFVNCRFAENVIRRGRCKR